LTLSFTPEMRWRIASTSWPHSVFQVWQNSNYLAVLVALQSLSISSSLPVRPLVLHRMMFSTTLEAFEYISQHLPLLQALVKFHSCICRQLIRIGFMHAISWQDFHLRALSKIMLWVPFRAKLHQPAPAPFCCSPFGCTAYIRYISRLHVVHMVSVCLASSPRSNANLFLILWFAAFISTPTLQETIQSRISTFGCYTPRERER